MRLPRWSRAFRSTVDLSRHGSAGLAKVILALVAAGVGTASIARVASSRAAATPFFFVNDTTFYFGPTQHNGTSGNGTVYIDQITISVVPGQLYKLRIVNGNTNGTNRVNSAVTKWNGKEVVSSSNITSSTPSFVTELAATPTDTMRMTLVGPAGSFIKATVFSVPDPAYNIFGDSLLNIPTGTSKAYSLTLTVPTGAAPPYRMYVVNGNASGGQRVTGQWIKINGTTITANGDLSTAVGSFTKVLTELSASNSLNLNLNGPTGSFIRMRITATDTVTPQLTVIAPAESTTVNATSIPSNGTIVDQTPTSVTINGAAATVVNNATWSATVPLPVTGWQTLTYVATDAGGKARTVLRHIRRVTDPPVLTLTAPADNSFTASATTLVTGTVTGVGTITVNTNGTPLTVNGTAVSGTVPLVYGVNTLVTTANDPSGNSVNVVRTVTRDTLRPALTVTSPVNNSVATSDSVTVSGTVTDATVVTVSANGINLPVTSGSFSKKLGISAGANTITIVATDQANNSTTVIRAVDFGDVIPPDPSTIAPPLPPTGMAAFVDATSFLYTGANAIQVGVAPGAMDPNRVAVIRGKVFARDGGAIAAARIYILDHPELGLTHSRADGRFDIAVNGGGPLVVQYERAGYLPSQRSVKVPWQDYVAVDSVALVPMDTVATVVDLASPSISVAQSSTVSDADGPRQATILVKPGTTATMTLPGGGTQPLTTLTIRASEYTVGSQGRSAMPAALPMTSAYTYAAEYTVDEAVAAGATNVAFSQPLPMYLDNFLGVPTGTVVPIGSYDKLRASWVPEENGRVIKILSIGGGTATVDVTGSGSAASQAALDSLGINTAELQRLAMLYPANKTLWRARAGHFSVWDWNFRPRPNLTGPPGAPRGAGGSGGGPWGSGGPPGSSGGPTDDRLPGKEPHECPGSIIECENSVLGERLPIAGTPFTLNYRSDRVPGNARAYELLIPVTTANVPAGLVRADVDVTVAGKTVEASFMPTPNQNFRFTWDGLDAYGRQLRGQQRMSVRVHYIYPMVYYMATATAKAFGLTCVGDSSPSSAICDVAGTWSRNAQLVETRQYQAVVGSAQPRGLGGWTLSPNHLHDEAAETIHLGSGDRQQVVGYNVARLAAGTEVLGYAGDGGPAISAKLNWAGAVAVAANGDVYFSDQHGTLIRRFTPGGTIGTLAGTVAACSVAPCGDGGPAGQATFSYISALAFGADGTLFIADSIQKRVRRIDPDGIIRPFAGSGSWCLYNNTQLFNCGDGGPALEAELHPIALSVASDGGVLIASSESIWKVRTDGTILIVAGLSGCSQISGFPDCGDEGPARQSKVNPKRVVARPDGGYYILNGWANRIRYVDANGIIHAFAVAGQCGAQPSCGDGGPALQALFGGTQGAALGPDGSLYVGEAMDGGPRIRRIGPDGIVSVFAGIPNGPNGTPNPWYGSCPPLAGIGKVDGWWAVGDGLCGGNLELAVGPDGKVYSSSNASRVIQVAPAITSPTPTQVSLGSADGNEVFRFDASGKHLDTRDAATGIVRYTFGYNVSGLLASITDANSNVTTIQRDGSGNPTAIVAPHGQVTAVALDANGYLARLVGAQNDTTLLTHDSGGMLTALRDPNGFAHAFTFDSTGRLTFDLNPAGGSTAPVRTTDSTGFSVLQTSAMGRTWQYGVHRQADGSFVRTATGSAGFTTTTTARPDGSVSVVAPSGMVTDYTLAPDPVLGLQAPRLATLNIRSPGGRNFSLVVRGGATKDPLDASRVLNRADTAWVNNRAFITAYDGNLRKYIQTTPMGRQSISFVDSLGRVTQMQTPGLNTVSLTYDSLGRVKQMTSANRTLRYTYNAAGHVDSIVDPLNRPTTFAYDNLGRVISQINPGGAVIGFTYDLTGRLTSFTPPGRSPHLLTYNPIGLATGYTPPGGTATSASWNADGQVENSVTADGDTLHVIYDASGRTQSVSGPTGSFGGAYHPTTGSLLAIKNAAGDSLKYGYDGLLPTALTWTGAVPGTVGFTYNNDLSPATVSVNGLQLVSYGYDTDGLMTQAGSLILTRHAQHGAVTGTSLGAVQTSYGYNGFGELANQGATVSASSVYSVTYTRDDVGRITTLQETVQGVASTWEYIYDTPGRLKDVKLNGALVRSYGFDSNGNRTSLTGPGLNLGGSYDGQDRLTLYGSAQYNWNNAGQIKFRIVGTDTTKFTYDPFGNLTRFVLSNGTDIQYLVDGQHRRIGKKVNGALVKGWLYQGQLAPIAELDGSGQVVSKFVYTTRANVPDYMVKGGVTYRFVTDHLGSIRLVVDQQTGSVAQRLDYDEWGQVLQNTNPGFQPFGFGGGLYDEQTGLARFGARDYDSQTGRWLSKDPIGLGGGDPNLYAFVFNDPINGRDPSGLWSLGDLLTPARVNGIAGFGDALLFGFGDDLRSLFGIENVDQCSEEYRRGNRIGAGAMLLTGGGRLAYAGLAKGIPLIAGEATEEAARWALNARNSLKIIFRLGLDRTSRIVDLAALELKYGPGNWTAIIEAAGRTSATWNAGGAAGVLGGAAALLGGPDCGCKP